MAGETRSGIFSGAALIASALVTTGCTERTADQPPPAAKAEEPTITSVAVYDCDGLPAYAEFLDDRSVRLQLPDGTHRLPSVPAASGARYEAGGLRFWTKGTDEALLAGAEEASEGEDRQCRRDFRASQRADAFRRGAYFRGQGNEPGWTVEIAETGIALVTDYGATTLSFPATAAQPDQDLLFPDRGSDAAPTRTYSAEADSHRLRLQVVLRGCNDDMSGEAFTMRVLAELDGRQLRGCGDYLAAAGGVVTSPPK